MVVSRKCHLEERVIALEKGHQEIVANIGDLKNDTQLIITTLRGATVLGKFAKTHGPRLFAFAMGLLVASGYISQTTAHTIMASLGLG